MASSANDLDGLAADRRNSTQRRSAEWVGKDEPAIGGGHMPHSRVSINPESVLGAEPGFF